MSTLSNKLVAACMVTAISMVMYGCGGGGGGGGSDEPVTPPTPTPCAEGEMRNDAGDCVAVQPPGPTEEEITKAAGTKGKAIKAESMQTTDAGLGGSDVDTVTMMISRDRDGTTVKITDSGLAGDDDPKYEQRMDLGGGTTMHSRIMEADDDGNVVEEVAIVSTDIKAPKATAFATVHGPLDVSTDAPDTTNEALAVGQLSAETVALVMSSSFTANTGAVLTFNNDNAATEDMDEAFETSGTYDGAMGTYRCNGSSECTVMIGDADATMDGVQLGVTAMSDDWVFIPDMGATSDVADSDYLHYGVWLKKTTDADDAVTYNEVETFAGSSEARTTDSLIAADGEVTGKATYSGGATGVYVNSVLNPNGTEASATSGHFTADVALTAYFNQTLDDAATDADEAGQIAPGMLNSLSGTINNFMLSGHDQGPGWSVSLEQTDIDGTGTDPHVNGEAKGGGADGNYQATFHGGGGDDDDQPSSVVGEFNAFFSNGSVAGGFGATKDAE